MGIVDSKPSNVTEDAAGGTSGTGAGAGAGGVGAGGAGAMPVPSGLQPASPPAARRMRAYFAPVDRATGTPTFFDPSQATAFDPDAPPSPWVDLGWIDNFQRTSGSKIAALRTGSPTTVQGQVRTELEATVSLRFLSWGKLQLALAAASEQMNLLAPSPKAAVPSPSGGTALAAATTVAGSSSTTVLVDPTTSGNLAAGDIIAVDADYTTQTGYVGLGASAAYITADGVAGGTEDYVRRVTLNVAKVVAVDTTPPTTLTLLNPLLGGSPAAGLGVQRVIGFVDREGGNFFQEWSALFAAEGQQGDWIFYHYPRLQAMQGPAEIQAPLQAPLEWVYLDAHFRALPVTDNNDGAQVLCFRSYLPAPNNAV